MARGIVTGVCDAVIVATSAKPIVVSNRGGKAALVTAAVAWTVLFFAGLTNSDAPPVVRVVAGLLCVVSGISVSRSIRLGIVVDSEAVTIRNLGRTYVFTWKAITSISNENARNITDAARCVLVRTDGASVLAKGTASYSRRKVDGYVETLKRIRDQDDGTASGRDSTTS
jgi:hypothetical protein